MAGVGYFKLVVLNSYSILFFPPISICSYKQRKAMQGRRPIETVTVPYSHTINERSEAGWDRPQAQAHLVLISVCLSVWLTLWFQHIILWEVVPPKARNSLFASLSLSLSVSVTFPPGIVDGQKVSMWNCRRTGQKVDGQTFELV